VVATVDIPEDGILLLNDRYDERWDVRLDDEEAEVLRCNYIMRGVRIPAGRHRVTFVFAPYRGRLLVALLSLALLAAWAALRCLVTRVRGAGIRVSISRGDKEES